MRDITMMGDVLGMSIKAYGEASPRSLQSAKGIMGPSDLGWCQMKALLMSRGVEQSDSSNIAAAQIGTAIHAYVAEALKARFPAWIVDERKVTATFPCGAAISGTPDVIAPDFNAIVDVKTVDGFQWVKREGSSRNHRWQRHTYALGAIQEGLLDGSKTVYVANLYIDRSGKESEPYFVFEEFDPMLTDEIDSWIRDVIYALQNGTDAEREIPAPVCEQICSHYTTCRGSLPVHEGGDLIDDEVRLTAIKMFVEGRDMEKEGSQMKREAAAVLFGTNGSGTVNGTTYNVRNTWVNPTTVDSFEKAGYNRLDVRKARGQ